MVKTTHFGRDSYLLSEQQPLTTAEKNILIKIRDKKIWIILSSYVVLLTVLILAWAGGPYKGRRSRSITEEDIERYKVVAPILIGIFFIALTIYFVNYYFKTLHPYIKDIKAGIKELLYYEPESYKTPFFETYYIKTISKKRAIVRVTKELYDAIQPGCRACISLSPSARFVFSIAVDEKKIEFNEKNSILDL